MSPQKLDQLLAVSEDVVELLDELRALSEKLGQRGVDAHTVASLWNSMEVGERETGVGRARSVATGTTGSLDAFSEGLEAELPGEVPPWGLAARKRLARKMRSADMVGIT
ncbi:hypothetical protein CYMTET_51157 [Cymbomonas tetramitiformis]|uniref:Uncharacterized protein n=1 Tax=Cymbomonas tetramitiformis TaxID=36881 RepID=A0AAE0BLU5_9CHLO|nr:hypothetical protein CYMTET_51157 [Cymbomonas tetramitiformis]